MRKILFLTSYASPYRVEFFDELGKYADLTVLLSDRKEDQTHRSGQWFVEGKGNFKMVQLEKCLAKMQGRQLCTDVISWMRQKWDDIIICGYSSPTAVLAMYYLRMKKIPFYLEVDGGLIREDSPAKYRMKRNLVAGASGWFSTGAETTRFLTHYGARKEAVYEYPFTSLRESDILKQLPTQEEKQALRRELGIREPRMILTVGQFIRRKGFDVLLKAAELLGPEVGICIVGGEPTEEYLNMREKMGLDHVYFAGFQKKDALKKYYLASDLFVLPTREDIWGLVVNEAMACGLPVITTDRCVAGLELVTDGVSGYIVPAEDEKALAEKISLALNGDLRAMGQGALDAVAPYTLQNMAKVHMDILEGRRS